MIKKYLIFGILLFHLFLTYSCAWVKKDNCLVDKPPLLLDHTKALLEAENFFNNFKCGDSEIPAAYLNKSSCEIKSDITFELLQKIFATAGKKIKNNGRNWKLKPWLIDLDGDNINEYILLFWDDSAYYSTLCVLKKMTGEWKSVYADEIQGWSYRPADIFVTNTSFKEKTIVCSYESITHGTGEYQNRYRVLKFIDGTIQTLLDIPQESFNCFIRTNINLSPKSDSFILNVSYAYSYDCMPTDGKEIILFEGDLIVTLKWEESKKTYTEDYGKDKSGNEFFLNKKKFHFIIENKDIQDASFADIWKAELLERWKHATPREKKAIDEILKVGNK